MDLSYCMGNAFAIDAINIDKTGGTEVVCALVPKERISLCRADIAKR